MQLPKQFRKDTVSDVEPGDKVYIVPWAMFVGFDDHLWINGDRGCTYVPAEPYVLPVIRKENGFAVDLASCSYKWNDRGPVLSNSIPVVELLGC